MYGGSIPPSGSRRLAVAHGGADERLEREDEVVVDPRLAHVVRGSRFADLEDAFLVVVPADRDDRQSRGGLLQLPRRLDAVQNRHLDIHHDGVGLEPDGELDGHPAVARAAGDLESPVRFEHGCERVEKVLVVFCDEDSVRRRPHRAQASGDRPGRSSLEGMLGGNPRQRTRTVFSAAVTHCLNASPVVLDLHAARIDCALGRAAFRQASRPALPLPYLAWKASLPSDWASAMQSARATVVTVELWVVPWWSLTQAPMPSLAPYFALKASAPSRRYSALQAASGPVGVGAVDGGVEVVPPLALRHAP